MAELEREKTALRDAIAALSSAALKSHMLAALDAFQPPPTAASGGNAASTTSEDEVAKRLRASGVRVQQPRVALFTAVHALLLEGGFEASSGSKDTFALPGGWDANSDSGLITASYKHENDNSVEFNFQGLFVGPKFEIYLSNNKNSTYSLELSTATFIKDDAPENVLAVDALQDLETLRSRVLLFIDNAKPSKKPEATTPDSSTLPSFHPLGQRSPPPIGGSESPFAIPSVGGGDVFPPALGGGSSGMLVGPDHSLFGRHRDPSAGPVPGARFDPFGPPIDPVGFGPRAPPFRGPAPGAPFGDPNPDHLRMPRDDDMDPGFGFGGRGGGRRGGGGDPFSRPFGSDNMFF